MASDFSDARDTFRCKDVAEEFAAHCASRSDEEGGEGRSVFTKIWVKGKGTISVCFETA